MYKAVIFDCDGTLVDSEHLHYLAWQASLEKLGYLLDKEFYINHFSGVGDFEISKILEGVLGFGCAQELLSYKSKSFEDYQAKGIASIAPTVKFARCLFEQKERLGMKLAVASGAGKEEILRNLKSLNIEYYFDAILSGLDDLSEYQDLEGTNKPKPYVYLKTAKILGVLPEECVAIEDSQTGVFSAFSAGCFTVAIPNHYTKQHNLSQAHMQLESLAGLSVDDFFKIVRSSKGSSS